MEKKIQFNHEIKKNNNWTLKWRNVTCAKIIQTVSKFQRFSS